MPSNPLTPTDRKIVEGYLAGETTAQLAERLLLPGWHVRHRLYTATSILRRRGHDVTAHDAAIANLR